MSDKILLSKLRTVLKEKSETIDKLIKEHIAMREEINALKEALKKEEARREDIDADKT